METKVLFISRLSFSKEKKFLNVTPSSKVDVGDGDVSVSEESPTAAEQLNSKEKQIEYVTGKFRYDPYEDLCMVHLYVTLFK